MTRRRISALTYNRFTDGIGFALHQRRITAAGRRPFFAVSISMYSVWLFRSRGRVAAVRTPPLCDSSRVLEPHQRRRSAQTCTPGCTPARQIMCICRYVRVRYGRERDCAARRQERLYRSEYLLGPTAGSHALRRPYNGSWNASGFVRVRRGGLGDVRVGSEAMHVTGDRRFCSDWIRPPWAR